MSSAFCPEAAQTCKAWQSWRWTAQLFVNAGYNFYEWEDYLQEIDRLKLQMPRKQN